jgi:hypothetical protein
MGFSVLKGNEPVNMQYSVTPGDRQLNPLSSDRKVQADLMPRYQPACHGLRAYELNLSVLAIDVATDEETH